MGGGEERRREIVEHQLLKFLWEALVTAMDILNKQNDLYSTVIKKYEIVHSVFETEAS